MEGWSKVIAGALIGVAGTVYATNEEFRKRLPGAARDLPVSVRDRFANSVAAAREASAKRRTEILKELEDHDASEGVPPATKPVRPVLAPEAIPKEPAAKDFTGTTPPEAG